MEWKKANQLQKLNPKLWQNLLEIAKSIEANQLDKTLDYCDNYSKKENENFISTNQYVYETFGIDYGGNEQYKNKIDYVMSSIELVIYQRYLANENDWGNVQMQGTIKTKQGDYLTFDCTLVLVNGTYKLLGAVG